MKEVIICVALCMFMEGEVSRAYLSNFNVRMP